jgi:uncharacterized SAM-binding protein YcdF (DUF218 family)
MKQRRVWWILLGALALIGATLVLLTFVWFVNPPTEEIETVQPADAVVVFVGSSERLETAVELMEQGVAPSLVIPNGSDLDDAEDLCEEAPFQVFCPVTVDINTRGEAQAIGRIAEEQGWSSLIAVTSVYHVHRATFLLGRCYEGPVEVVTPSQDLDTDDWVEKIGHEWAGTLAALVLPRSC